MLEKAEAELFDARTLMSATAFKDDAARLSDWWLDDHGFVSASTGQRPVSGFRLRSILSHLRVEIFLFGRE